MGIKHASSVGSVNVQVDVTFSHYMEIQEIVADVPDAEPYLDKIPFRVARNQLAELMGNHGGVGDVIGITASDVTRREVLQKFTVFYFTWSSCAPALLPSHVVY